MDPYLRLRFTLLVVSAFFVLGARAPAGLATPAEDPQETQGTEATKGSDTAAKEEGKATDGPAVKSGEPEQAGDPENPEKPTKAKKAKKATTPKKAKKQLKTPDVIFVPTPPAVVDKMLELAAVEKTDIIYDLGCGDGRIVVAAAKKFGCKAYGFDVDPVRIRDSKANVKKEKLAELVTIEQKDIFTLDLSKANVLTLYLLPSLNVKLIPQIDKMKPGCRIVSHDFDMAGVEPDQLVEISTKDGVSHKVYLWTTPLKKTAPAGDTEEGTEGQPEEEKAAATPSS